MRVKTQARVDVDLSLNSDEAKLLLDHLKATVTDGELKSLTESLDFAINGKPKQTRTRKTEEEKAAAKAAKVAAKAEKAEKTKAEKPATPAQTAPPVAGKTKITVPA